MTVAIFMESNKDFIKEPEILNKIERLQSYLESLPKVDKAFSIVDYLKWMNRAMHSDESQYEVLPKTKEMAAQYLFLYTLADPDDLDYIVDYDYSKARIVIRTKTYSSADILDLKSKIEDYLSHNFSDRLKYLVSSSALLALKAADEVVYGQLRNTTFALIVIFAIIMLFFRSLKMGSICLLPNVLPIIINYGIMGLFNIFLDIGASIIAPIAVGIAVDDTIHILYRFKKESSLTENRMMGILRTLCTTGISVILTSLVLIMGLIIMIFSNFLSIFHVGLLMPLIMVYALLGDLILLPASLSIFYQRRERKEVTYGCQ